MLVSSPRDLNNASSAFSFSSKSLRSTSRQEDECRTCLRSRRHFLKSLKPSSEEARTKIAITKSTYASATKNERFMFFKSSLDANVYDYLCLFKFFLRSVSIFNVVFKFLCRACAPDCRIPIRSPSGGPDSNRTDCLDSARTRTASQTCAPCPPASPSR